MLYNDSRLAWRGSAPWRRHFSALVGRFRLPGHCRPGRGRRRRRPGWSRISHRCRWRANSRIVPSRGPGGVPGTARRWCRLPRVDASRTGCMTLPQPTPSADARTGPARCGDVTRRAFPRRPNLPVCRDGIVPWPSSLPCRRSRGTTFCPVPAQPCRTGCRVPLLPGFPPPCDTVPGRQPGGWLHHAGADPRPSAARSGPVPVSCFSRRRFHNGSGQPRGNACRSANTNELPCVHSPFGDNARGPPPGVYPGPWWAQRR